MLIQEMLLVSIQVIQLRDHTCFVVSVNTGNVVNVNTGNVVNIVNVNTGNAVLIQVMQFYHYYM